MNFSEDRKFEALMEMLKDKEAEFRSCGYLQAFKSLE